MRPDVIEFKSFTEVNLNMKLTQAQYEFYLMLVKGMYARPRHPWVRKGKQKTKRF